MPLQANTTVCSQTVDHLPAVRDLVRELGAVLWSVFLLVPVGRGRVLDPQERGGSGPQRRGGITAGDGFAFVSHTGEVYPSGFLPESAGKCGACSFRRVCGGSRSRAYAVTGDSMGSDPLCLHVPENYDGPLPSRLGAADD